MPDVAGIDLAALVEPVQAVARAAGRQILDVYAAGFSVTQKADHSPVTEADFAAHRCILRGLAQITPGIPVLSEEDAEVSFAERRHWEWLWLVDPLDGTREFIRHSDEFSVNIALIHHHTPVLGLILPPVADVCYYAWHGGGAFRQLAGHAPEQVRAARVCHDPVRVVSSRSAYHTRRLRDYLHRLGPHQPLTLGGALKSCWVAEGSADLYPRFGPTGEWDTAAAQIILEQAGGYLTDAQFRPLRYNARPELINPDFFAFGDPSRDWTRYLPAAPSRGHSLPLLPSY